VSGSVTQLIGGLFWPSDATTQAAILLLLGLAAVALATVHGPLVARLVRVSQLRRSVQACFDEESSNAIQRQEVANAFTESPLAFHWSEFVRRWQNAIAADPIQDASLPELSRAPVRIADVFAEHPILPAGARHSLLPGLPAIFLCLGLVGAFAGLVLALPEIGLSLDPPSFDATSRSEQISSLMDHLGMALRIGLWGLMLSLAASIGGRVIEGRFESLAETLDSWVQLAYGAISTGELATRTAHEHRGAILRLQDEVAELSRQVSARPRPLIRSTVAAPGAPPAAVDAEATARAIEGLGSSLSEHVARQIDRVLGEQLAALRESLGGAIEKLAGRPADSGLGDVVERLVKSSESQNAASRSLTQTAHSVSDAAGELRSGLDDFADAVTQVRETGAALQLTAQRVESGQAAASRASEALAGSLARAQETATEHRERIESGVEEIRSLIAGLVRALENETPLPSGRDAPAADTSALQSRLASVGDRLDGLASEMRSSLEAQLAALASGLREELGSQMRETTRALAGQLAGAAPTARETPRPPSETPIDEEPRKTASPGDAPAAAEPAATEDVTQPDLRRPAAARTEEDTIPYMKVPSPEAIARGPSRSAGAKGDSRATLTGLLRPTHHSGPSSTTGDDLPPLDPQATIALGREEIPVRGPDPAERGDDDDDDGDETPRRRGLFGRRK